MKYNLEMNKMDYQKKKKTGRSDWKRMRKKSKKHAEKISRSDRTTSERKTPSGNDAAGFVGSYRYFAAQSGTSGKWNKSTDAGCVRKIRISPWDAYRN